jgi:uncharacterized membrane protein YbhN (UPF0104 family)
VHISVVLLTVSLRAVGVDATEVRWQTVLSAYAVVQLMSLVPISVGNVGVAEIVLIGALGRRPELRDGVGAAVLIYRGATFVAPLPIGAAVLAITFWRPARSTNGVESSSSGTRVDVRYAP